MEIYRYIFGFTIFFIAISIVESDKPSGLTQGIYCEGCIATVKELLKKLDKKTGESREVKVIEAMEDICNLQNFGSYEYSPPKTGQACKHLIEIYDEEIEEILMDNSTDFEKEICYKLTKACKGVDRSKKEKEELEVNINNEKQKLQTGKVEEPEKFHVDINEEGAAKKLVDQINMAVKNKKNVGDSDDDDDDDEDDDDEDEDDEEENANKLDEEAEMETVEGDDIENLADSLEDAKTEL